MRTKTPQYAERILEAASRLFAGRSFHEVRMEDVAGEAAVSKGTLYRYFRDKDELYAALLKRAGGQLSLIMTEEVGRYADARERLVALVQSVVTFFDAQPHLFQLILRSEPQHHAGRFPWQETRDVGNRLATTILAEGTQRGEIAVRTPAESALTLLGGLRQHIGYGDRPRPAHFARWFVEEFLEGADRKKSTPPAADNGKTPS